MDKPKLLFTKNYAKTRAEVEKAGGRILHRLSDGMVVISRPKSLKLKDLKSCKTATPARMSADEKIVLKAWRATHAAKGTRMESMMRRSPREQLKWDAPNFTAPEEDDPTAQAGQQGAQPAAAAGVSESTGIPTSLYLTESVAMAVVIVSGQDWTRVSGSLKYVSVASDGTVWGVNSNDNIYRHDGSSWKRISGSLKQVSAGSSSKIWGVNSNDNIYQRSGSSWTPIAGSLKHVSAAADGTVWGVKANDDIYRRDGSSWTKIPGSLKQISVGSSTEVWGVNANGNIYQWNGSGWTLIPGRLKHVAVASDGTVWGANNNDNIYHRKGNAWEQISGSLKQLSVGSPAHVWGVKSGDAIYERKVLATP